MKILVIDDTQIHLDAAVAQLGTEHEVVTVSSANEALTMLGCGYAYGEDISHAHSFDAVLCDLLLPSPGRACYASDEMDTGMYLAITAARNGAKYVGLLTDSNHHRHPASDCLDSIRRDGQDVFEIDGALVCMTNDTNLVDQYDPTNLAKPLEYQEYSKRKDTVRAKNWEKLLKHIMREVTKRSSESHSVGALMSTNSRLSATLAEVQEEAQREKAELQAKLTKLENEAKENGKKMTSLREGLREIETSSNGWWQRKLSEKIKNLLTLTK